MNVATLTKVVKAGFALDFAGGHEPRFKFSGTGDMEATTVVEPYLRSLHTELLAAKATAVVVDFSELYFMNSSCVKAFVSWIHQVNTEGRAYRIVFQANARLHWQSRSLATLKRLAPFVVTIREVRG